MTLQLNKPTISYKEFYGRNIDKMPELLAEGFSPMTYAQIMKKRLEVMNSTQELKDAWHLNYFDTADAIALNSDGTGKMIMNSQIVRDLNPNSKIKNGALNVSDVYDSLVGENLSKEDFQKYAKSESLTKKEVLKNKIWNILANGDSKLLEDFTNMTFSEGKQRFGYDKMMGIYASSFQDTPTLRLWLVGRVSSNSLANGNNYINDSDGRLVGVAPEAQGARETGIITPTLEQIMKVSSKMLLL